MYWVAVTLAVVVMILGALLTLVPIFPGLPMVWLTALVFGWWDGFERIGMGFLGAGLAAVVAVNILEYFARAWGVRRFGGSRAAATGAVIGSIIGVFLGPWGLILGPFLGALAGELLSGAAGRQALRAGLGGVIGVLGGVVLNFALACTLIVAFLYQVLGGA